MLKKTTRLILMLFIVLNLAVPCFAMDTVTPTSNLQVKNDNGTGNVYGELATNYVQFGDLDLSKAKVSGSGYHTMSGFSGTTTGTRATILYYETKYSDLKWGSNASSSANGSPKATTLPAVTLTFPNAALLSDGSSADVCITDTPKIFLGENLNSSISGNTKLKVAIMRYDNKGRLWFSLTAPKIDLDRNDYTSEDKSTGAGTARHDTVTITIRKPGTTTAVSAADYPSMLLVFKDLDTPDHMVKSSASNTARWNGDHAEGITLEGSGWGNPVALAPDKSSDHITARCLVNKKITSDNCLKIKLDGKKVDLLEDAGIKYNDYETYYSGFAAAGTPQGLKFSWDGSIRHGSKTTSDMGTVIGAQPTVEVKSKRSAGGSLRGSKLNEWGDNTHLMNSSADYDYKPDAGYRVKSLKVDGKDITLTETQKSNGGVYTFTRLNKYPVEVKDREGNVLGASDSSYYTIEATFEKIPEPAFTQKKECLYTGQIVSGSSAEIPYRITIEETASTAAAGTYTFHDDMGKGTLHLVPESLKITAVNGSCSIVKADDTGIDLKFSSNQVNGGTKPKLVADYKVKVNWDKIGNSKVVKNNYVSNNIYNNVVLKKVVAGNSPDSSKKFDYTVEMSGLDKNMLSEVTGSGELVSVTTGTKSGSGFKPDKNGSAVIKIRLAHNQTLTIKNLLCGSKYKITEDAAPGYKASYKITAGLSTAVITSASGANTAANKALSTAQETADAADGDVQVTFSNASVAGNLRIQKNVTGNLGDTTKEFEFTVTLGKLPPSWTGSFVNEGAVLTSGFTDKTYKSDANGKAVLKFRLKDDAALSLKGLPVGTTYEITEAKSDHNPSYTVTKGKDKIASGAEKKHAQLSTGTLAISEEADFTAVFVNYRNMIPVTGNTERGIPFTVPAAVCLIVAVLIASRFIGRSTPAKEMQDAE